jgi:hypothetical protein
MSIRLAASKPLRPLVNNPLRLRRMRAACANDNSLSPARQSMGRTRGNILHAALRHFAAHGLSAAQNAADEAKAARVRGDDAEYNWWRDICHALDRQMARKLGS